jgi:formate hydrogenlyase subunit 3/multisubunit Na+/H+ antiporter MnhD subunit
MEFPLIRTAIQPVDAAVTLSVAWIALGIAGLALVRVPRLITGVVFPVGAVVSLALAATGLWAISAPPSAAILPAGLPDCRSTCAWTRCRVSSCCCWAGSRSASRSFPPAIFAAPRLRRWGLLSLQYHVFIASMAFVQIADGRVTLHDHLGVDGAVVVFLVTTEHPDEANRRAGFIYLLVAHVGAIAILLSFGVLDGGRGDYTFDGLRGPI